MDTDNEARFFLIGALAFATGLLVGVGAGLLMAPQSGARTRRHISGLVDELKDDAADFAKEAKDVVEGALDGVIEKGKRFVK